MRISLHKKINNVDNNNLALFTNQNIEPTKLFGLFTYDFAQKALVALYLFVGFLLAALLLTKVLVRFHIQRHTIIAHTLAVFILAMVLILI